MPKDFDFNKALSGETEEENPAEITANQNIRIAKDLDPEAEARRYDLSQKSGNPLALVREREDDIRKDSELPNPLSYQGAPKTALYFTNPDNAAISSDDMEPLANIERAMQLYTDPLADEETLDREDRAAKIRERELKGFVKLTQMGIGGKLAHAFREGSKTVARSGISFLEGMAQAEMRRERAEGLESVDLMVEQAKRSQKPTGLPGEAAQKAWAQWGDDMRAAKILEMNYLPREEGVVQYMRDVAGMTPLIAGQIGVTAAGGAPAGMAFMFSQIAGGQYEQLIAEGVDPDRAWTASVVNASIQSPMEAIGMGRAFKAWRPSNLKNAGVKDFFESMTTEFFTEFLQSYPDAATTIWGKAEKMHQDPVDQVNQFFEDFMSITKSGMYEGLVAAPFGGGMSAAGSIINYKAKVKEAANQVAQSDEFVEQMGSVSEAIGSSATAERSPQKMAEFLEMAGTGKEVFLTPEGTQELLQGENGAEMMGRLGLDVAKAQEAAVAGQDLTIPLSKALSELSPEEFTSLVQDLKPAPGAISSREAEKVDLDAAVKELSTTFKEEIKTRKINKKKIDAIQKSMLEAGHTKEAAQKVGSLLESIAQRFGLKDTLVPSGKDILVRTDQTVGEMQQEAVPPKDPAYPDEAIYRDAVKAVQTGDISTVKKVADYALRTGKDLQSIHHHVINASMKAAEGMNPEQLKDLGAKQAAARTAINDAGYIDALAKGGEEAFQDLRDKALRDKLVEEMTPGEKDKALLLNPLSHIPNRRSYAEDNKKTGGPSPVQVSIDLDSLKWVNDNLGHHAGDEFLINAGKVLELAAERMGVKGYHFSGDEFAMQSGDNGKIADAILFLTRSLENVIIRSKPDKSGYRIAMKGIRFGFGTNEKGDMKDADERLGTQKKLREKAGLRSDRGKTPPNITVFDFSGRELDPGAARAHIEAVGKRRDAPSDEGGGYSDPIAEAVYAALGIDLGAEANILPEGADKMLFSMRNTVYQSAQDPQITEGETIHEMPDGALMAGPAHEGAVEGSERVATEADVQTFNSQQDEVLQQAAAPVWFSALEKQLSSDKFAGKGTGSSYASTIRGWIKKGILKAEEVEWSGLLDWLDNIKVLNKVEAEDGGKKRSDKLTREDILEFVRQNGVQVEEVVLGTPEAVDGIQLDIEELLTRKADIAEEYEEHYGEDWQENPTALSAYEGDIEDINAEIQELDDQVNIDAQTPGTKFSKHQLPGGENYKELMLMMPVPEVAAAQEALKTAENEYLAAVEDFKNELIEFGGIDETQAIQLVRRSAEHELNPEDVTQMEAALGADRSLELRRQVRKTILADREAGAANRKAQNLFTSSHFDEPNVLAHIRFNEREDSEGNKVLFIEEIQSDWHQAGRKKGYKSDKLPEGYEVKEMSKGFRVVNPDGGLLSGVYDSEQEAVNAFNMRSEAGVPNAPFKKTWPNLALKRMVRYAAENGFDKIAWTTGEQQAERYDLSKHLDKISYAPSETENNYDVVAYNTEGAGVLRENGIGLDRIEALVGKEITQKIKNSEGIESSDAQTRDWRDLSGLDLKVGGEGMKGFYDKILPSAAKKMFGKKVWGNAKVEEIDVGIGDEKVSTPTTKSEAITLVNSGVEVRAVEPEGNIAEELFSQLDVENMSDEAEFYYYLADKVSSLTITPEMRDKALEEGLPLFQEKGEKGPRGSLRITDNQYIINMFKGSEISTILHEVGHIFMEELDTVVNSGQADEVMAEDYNTLLKWVGAKAGEDLTTPQKEKLARGWEAYLMEGKAPAQELESAFALFKKWLLNIYGSAKSLKVDLNDDVRKALDRLLAQNAEMAQAAEAQDMKMPSNKELDDLAVVKEDRDYMARLLKAASTKAESAMSKARNTGLRKNTKKWREKATREADNTKVYKAIEALNKGEGLDKSELVETYGEDILTAIPNSMMQDGGLDLDRAAYAYDYESSDALIEALKTAPPKDMFIENLVQSTIAEHDAQFKPEDYLTGTKEYGEYLDIRARYVNRSEGKPSNVKPVQALKLFARRTLNSMKVKEAIRHDRFLSAMKKYSRVEKQKILAKKMEEAASAGEKVRVNHELAGQSVKARKSLDKLIVKVKKAVKSKTIQFDYLENIRSIAQRFNLGTSSTAPQKPDTKKPLGILVGGAEGVIDQAAYFSDWIINESYSEDHKELTVEQLTEVKQLIDLMVGKGRDAHKAMMADGKTSIEEAANAIASDLAALPTKKVWDKLGAVRKLTDPLKAWISEMDALPFIATALGGYQNIGHKGKKGAADKLITDRLTQAMHEETLMNEAVYDKLGAHITRLMRSIHDLTKKHGKRIKLEGAPVPEALKSDGQIDWWTGEQIVSIALNMGNEGNIQRLYDGYEGLETSTVARLLDLLSKEDWNAIQGAWDTIDGLYHDIDAVHFKINHMHMDKIEAKPIKTKHGMYKGGYYPVRFDGSLMGAKARKAAEMTENEDLMSRNESMFQVPTGKSGFTKQRAGKVSIPLKLGLTPLTEHLRDTVHYITHAEAVRDIDRITRHEDLVEVAQKKLGKEMYAQVRPALKYIARPNREYLSRTDKMVDWLRGKTTAFILAWNVGVGFKQWFSSPSVIYEIGLKNYMKGQGKFMADGLKAIFTASPSEIYTQMHELSPFIRQRGKSMDRELAQMFRGMSPDQRAMYFGDKAITWDDARNLGFWIIRSVDMLTIMPIWKGSYDKAMRENGGDIDASVQYADGIVRKTQPSAQPLDMSHWQRIGGVARLFSMFQTFTVGKYGNRQRLHYRAWRAGQLSHADYASFNLTDVLIPALMMNMLFSFLWGEDFEDEETWEKIGTGVLKYAFLTGLPVIGDMFSQYGDPGDSPVNTGFVEIKRALANGGDFIADMSEDSIKRLTWQMARVASFIGGIPVTKVVDKAIKGSKQDGDNPIKYLVPAPKK